MCWRTKGSCTKCTCDNSTFLTWLVQLTCTNQAFYLVWITFIEDRVRVFEATLIHCWLFSLLYSFILGFLKCVRSLYAWLFFFMICVDCMLMNTKGWLQCIAHKALFFPFTIVSTHYGFKNFGPCRGILYIIFRGYFTNCLDTKFLVWD